MTYATVNTEDLSGYDFELLRQDRADTCRKSIDGTMAIVSWFGDMPDFIDPISTYDEQGIIDLIRGEDWTFEIEL